MRAFVITVAFVVMSASALASDALDADSIRQAVAAAVTERLGAGTQVIVDDVRIFTAPNATAPCVPGHCEAVPDPAAKIGRGMRFALVASETVNGTTRAVRVAHVEADVTVTATVVRATRLILRGDTIADTAVETAQAGLAGASLRRVPALADVVGSRALRDLAAGEALTHASILALPAVRTGQEVVAVSRANGIEVTATLVAADSGTAGSTIRVVNRDTRRTMRARVISSHEVEIIP